MDALDGLTVAEIWRYPVKSLGGESVPASLADEGGLLGDRVWAVLDGDGKLGSGKNSLRFRRVPGLLDLAARYPAEPGPDGTEHPVATGAADEFLRRHTGQQQVRICRDTGIMHFDEVPFTLLGTATLDWLARQLPGGPVSARRLRPNLVVHTRKPFIEETWLGRTVCIGTGKDAVHAVFDRVLERCVMVGMRQPGLTESGAVLKRIGQRDDNPLCMAIGGQITRPGLLRTGDPVTVVAS